MARPTKNQRQAFFRLIESFEPAVRSTFLTLVEDIQTRVEWTALLKALKAGDIELAIAALNIEEAAFQSLALQIESAYLAGGTLAAAGLRGPGGAKIFMRFDFTNPKAQEWILQYVGREIVTKMTNDTLGLVRQVIESGYARGEHPFTIALDIAGRVGQSGKRQGGILGLDLPRADRLQKVTVGMRSAEGVRGLVVMGKDGPRVRYAVNKATEIRILRAYNNGTAVPPAERILSEKQYGNALLKARAESIARTETGQAVMSSRFEAWRQAAEAKGYDVNHIRKTWRHGSHSKWKRPEHVDMNNVTVVGLYTPFEFPEGVMKQHALDGVGGGKHDINCGCSTDFRLDRAVGLA